MINDVLREYLDDFAMAYLDDILVYSKTLEEHERHVHMVLRKPQAAKLLVKATKCDFHTQKTIFLGCVVSPGQFALEPEKIAAVREWPQPQNVKDVRSFVGYVNYYRKFIKDYGKMIAPLTKLTRNDQSFQWMDHEQAAFEEIKTAVLSEPVLKDPDPDKPYEMEVDASGYAMGGELTQRDAEGRAHPIAFFSKKFTGPAERYPVHDKELMAIIEGLKEWEVYLKGARHPVTIYSDHKNLTYFANNQKLNGRQARWAQYLSEFDLRISYKKGVDNGKADALSRRSDHKDENSSEDETIFNIHQDGSMTLKNDDHSTTQRFDQRSA